MLSCTLLLVNNRHINFALRVYHGYMHVLAHNSVVTVDNGSRKNPDDDENCQQETQ